MLRLSVLATIVCLMLVSVARAEDDNFTLIERPGFAIKVPPYFEATADPPATLALEVWGPPGTDKRNLPWNSAVLVRTGKGANPQRTPAKQHLKPVIQSIKARYGADFIEGPFVGAATIAGADPSIMILYRVRQGGQQAWHYELYAHADTDIYIVSGILTAHAGSEVLEKNFPPGLQLRKSLLSFKVIRPAATQPSATQPAASRPASP